MDQYFKRLCVELYHEIVRSLFFLINTINSTLPRLFNRKHLLHLVT